MLRPGLWIESGEIRAFRALGKHEQLSRRVRHELSTMISAAIFTTSAPVSSDPALAPRFGGRETCERTSGPQATRSMTDPLILASRSPARAALLRAAGIEIEIVPAAVDEAAVKAALLQEQAPARDVADALAELKALRIGRRSPGRLVLGADQVLVCEGRIFNKPADPGEAAEHLRTLRGRTHELYSAAVICDGADPVWRHVGRVQMTMRRFSDSFLELLSAPDRRSSRIGRRLPARGSGRATLQPRAGRLFYGSGASAAGGARIPEGKRGMRRMSDQAPSLAGVIGWPIAQSRSPALHAHWLKRYGVDGHYVPLAVRPADFETAFVALPRLGFRGVNVTIPFKETVIRLADRVSDRAALIGAANTLTFLADGSVYADNTDGYGFLQNLRHHAPGWRGSAGPALVLGAGGAARAVVSALLADGAPEVRLANRTRARAEMLRDHFGARVVVVDWSRGAEAADGAATIVNTTSMGMTGQPELPFRLDAAPVSTLVNDIVYKPLVTPLLAAARARGMTAVDGLGMLLHQAAPGFEAWFGVRPEVDEALRDAVLGQ